MSVSAIRYGTYGYRFAEQQIGPLFRPFAVGFDRVSDINYDWDGMKRVDGPLYLLQYTVSGRGAIRIGDITHSLEAGQAFLVDIPGDHRYYLPEGSKHWEFYFILFRQQHAEGLWTDIVRKLGTVPVLPPDSPAVRTLRSLYIDAQQNRLQDAYHASAAVYQLLMDLLRSASSDQQTRDNWPDTVRLAAELIEQDCVAYSNLDEIAAAAGASKFHLSRAFTRYVGMPPMTYVTKLRMERAAELLRGSAYQSSAIAQRLGYSSASYFTKVFHQWVGCTPGEFREGRATASIDRLNIYT
ncbi:AraC family transcriptional regulator [Paenibacillus sp. CCS19]|uniref:AraC family transcriptional regulator n=1 Tax=Paenibacillus sp. CCS19 TaxID=3158387 RepID=UPI002561D283|nr:AraC family transcriptional regulator [Paenibacillus cellulosilyticus]GMK39905.1 AraC family transcriptional regulator [Paenibacillus cellulosilyticus]